MMPQNNKQSYRHHMQYDVTLCVIGISNNDEYLGKEESYKSQMYYQRR